MLYTKQSTAKKPNKICAVVFRAIVRKSGLHDGQAGRNLWPSRLRAAITLWKGKLSGNWVCAVCGVRMKMSCHWLVEATQHMYVSADLTLGDNVHTDTFSVRKKWKWKQVSLCSMFWTEWTLCSVKWRRRLSNTSSLGSAEIATIIVIRAVYIGHAFCWLMFYTKHVSDMPHICWFKVFFPHLRLPEVWPACIINVFAVQANQSWMY